VYQSLNNMLAKRPKVAVAPVVHGLTGFIMLDKNGAGLWRFTEVLEK
jgi:hypothetical protein